MRKSILLALATLTVLAASVAWLMSSAPPHAVRPAAAPDLTQEERRRLLFSKDLERRYRAKGQAMVVQALGEGQKILTLRWSLQTDMDQARGLQQAEALWAKLRELGFVRLELLHRDGRMFWSQDL